MEFGRQRRDAGGRLTLELATYYGLDAEASDGISLYDVSAIPERGGLLTQGSMLAIGGGQSDMVARGLFAPGPPRPHAIPAGPCHAVDAALSGRRIPCGGTMEGMSLLALQVLDVAIIGTMGGLWIFGAAFIYFVWRWAARTEVERANPVMRPGDPTFPPAAPLAGRAAKPLAEEPAANLSAGMPSPAST